MLPLLFLVAVQPPDAERFTKWDKEVAAIEMRLKEYPPKAGGVLFVGSSTIRLWDLKKSFPDAGYINVGFGGSEIRDCTHFAPRLVAPHKPKAIVFYAGDNDIASGRKPEQVLADFTAFAAAVHKDTPKCRILFLPVKPSIARWAKFDEQKKANALVKELCATDDRLVYVDIVPVMLGADGRPLAELFVKDGLHMNAAGYEKWSPRVKTALEQ
jgi:lysophospholipase L1-like esterase